MKLLQFFLLCSLSCHVSGKKNYLRALKSNGNRETQRPVIYTFFQTKIQSNGKLHETNTHDNLLAVWTELWYEAGWEPKILTLDDARKHPDYKKYRDDLTVGEIAENTYDYMCFMRWLAMASHGEGGWMSDYDAFPMGISYLDGLTLPNGGIFTGWERHVPSLLSGSAEEWDRISRMVLDMAVQKLNDENTGLYTDMYALHDVVVNNENEFIQELTVYNGFPYKEKHVVDCDRLENIMVVHLSHMKTDMAVESGIIESPIGKYDESIRPYLATLLNKEWKEQCFNKNNEAKRPVIYTFFQTKIQSNGKLHETNTHDNLLAVWTELWYEAGWEPKILTLDDSRKHPDFEKYKEDITAGEIAENTYDYMCFMRWLAMASHGEGGWMSDYDVFPMGISYLDGLTLPNGGIFTGWERHVPSLLSGSAEEWDRISRMVLDMAGQKINDGNIEFFSDMFILREITRYNEREFIQDLTVYNGFPYKENHFVDCNVLENIMVVHLSHMKTDMAVQSGLVKSPIGKYDESIRPHLATLLNKDWKEQCFNKNNEAKRPVIYTFFELKKTRNPENQRKNLHENLLAVWTELWYAAGWEPKILTLDDSRKHPDYEQFRNGIVENSAVGSYDYMCFMRWLAMASHGEGGWMSDYDAFPMGISYLDGLTLPNGGIFTGWERHVPSLLSGSAEEWNRISRMVLDMALRKVRDEKIEFYSDMYALHDVVVNNENEFIRDMKVYMGYPYKEKHVVDCEALENIMVVHLSHMRTDMAVESGIIESPIGKYDESIRPYLATLLNKEWKEQCIQDSSSNQ